MNRPIKFRCWKDGEMHGDAESKFWLSQGFEYDLMQFTGLLDKNGKEIYEGDMVQVFYHNSPQTAENKSYVVTIDDIRSGYSGVGYGNGEVIGNIYENPDLL